MAYTLRAKALDGLADAVSARRLSRVSYGSKTSFPGLGKMTNEELTWKVSLIAGQVDGHYSI
jgi:hypothetical protein